MRTNLWVFMLVFMFFSCGDNEKKGRSEKKVYPSSGGSEYEVLISSAHIRSDEILRNVCDSVFHKSIEALPQIEYLFKTHFEELARAKDLSKRHHNILILLNNENPDYWQTISDNKLKISDMEEVVPGIFYARNVWAEPQLLVWVQAGNKTEMLHRLLENQDRILTLFHRNERLIIKHRIYKHGYDQRTFRQTNKVHAYGLKVPNFFTLIKSIRAEEDTSLHNLGFQGMFWYRGITKKSNSNILVYYKDYKGETLPDEKEILKLKLDFSKAFIHGGNEGSYLSLQEMYPPHVSKSRFRGHDAFMIKGLWKLEKDFLGGPFITYVIHDKENNRLLFIDGFLFAHGSTKKRYVERMEIIMHSFSVKNAEKE
jgi:hypothetical protein